MYKNHTPSNWQVKGIIVGIAMIAVSACTGGSSEMGGGENTPGASKAVDLMASWVKAGAPNGSFTYEDLSGNKASGSFNRDILPLFTKDNIWTDDVAACTSCHFANSEDSYHEMDLSSYEGIMKGGDVLSQPPGVPLFGQSKVGATDYDWGHSKMKERLRNNRMPPEIEFDISEENRDGPCVEVGAGGATYIRDKYGCEDNAVGLLQAWVEAGAPKNAQVAYGGGNITFSRDVMPLFTEDGIWAEGTAACTSCHFANSEDSYHEMDLSSYEGIMKGGDVLSSPPGVPLFGQSKVGASDYDWGHSKMKGRLRNNRMPPGIEFDITEENRDGPIVLHGKRL